MSRHVSTYVEVDIGEFDDDDLVAEVIDRDLVTDVLKAAGRLPQEDAKPMKPNEIAIDVISHLMCRRATMALCELDRLVAAFVPPQVLAARDALASGHASVAICELERFVDPSTRRRPPRSTR